MSSSFLVIGNGKSWTKSSVLYLGCDRQSQRKQEPLPENDACAFARSRSTASFLDRQRAPRLGNMPYAPKVPAALTAYGLYDLQLHWSSD